MMSYNQQNEWCFYKSFYNEIKEDLKPTPFFTLVQFDNLKILLFNAFWLEQREKVKQRIFVSKPVSI